MAADQVHWHHFAIKINWVFELDWWTHLLHEWLNQAMSLYETLQLNINLVLDSTFDSTKGILLFELQAI